MCDHLMMEYIKAVVTYREERAAKTAGRGCQHLCCGPKSRNVYYIIRASYISQAYVCERVGWVTCHKQGFGT